MVVCLEQRLHCTMQTLGSARLPAGTRVQLQSDGADTLPSGLSFFQSSYGSDQSLVSAGAMLASLPVVVVYLVFPRHLISGLTAGAAEG